MYEKRGNPHIMCMTLESFRFHVAIAQNGGQTVVTGETEETTQAQDSHWAVFYEGQK